MREAVFILFVVVESSCALLLLGCFYMLFRNYWVYKNRIRLLHNNYPAYQKLPEYDTMMLRFWVWDVREFLK